MNHAIRMFPEESHSPRGHLNHWGTSTTLCGQLITDGEIVAWSHSVFRDSGAAQVLVGAGGRITVANPAALAMVERSSLTGTDMSELLAAPDRAALDAFLATVTSLPAGRNQGLGPVHLVGGSGTRQVHMIGSRTQGEGGFDSLLVALQELPAPAVGFDPGILVDPLTGVGTRARGLDVLTRLVSPGAPGCLLLLDLDGFAWINESLGHSEGDQILVEVARRLLNAVPPGATVARMDGDQFLVVSPSTPVHGSFELSAVVLSAIARPIHIAGTRVVTVSIGVADLAWSSVDEALHRAQVALAEARQQGGQQVVIDGPTLRTYGRRRKDVAKALREAREEAERARWDAAQAQAEAAQAQDEAARARLEARTCPMTGLPNHLAYQEARQLLEADARLSGAPVSAVFLDLDEFGTINKTFTWARGTETLAAVARTLAAQCRGDDRVFRYGGEEFVVLLADTDLSGAWNVAERLRAAVEDARIPHRGVPERPIVTLSVGVASGSGPKVVIANLVNRADEWSQLAKATGRNRVLPAGEVVRPADDRA